jgi:hypothetical protein
MEIDEVSSAAKAAGLIEVRMTTRVGDDELHAVTYISPTVLTDQSAFETVLDDLLFQSKMRLAGRYFGNIDPIHAIVNILGDASECTVDPERAEAIARRAIAEACDNREGK